MVLGGADFSAAFASKRSGYEMLDIRRRWSLFASRAGLVRDGETGREESVYGTIVN